MTDSESLANSLNQKFKKLIQLHQESLSKVVELEIELEQQRKKVVERTELLEQNFQKQLQKQEVLEQKKEYENKEIKQAIGKLIEEIEDCMDYLTKSKEIE
jgi:hypothetical protein